jgi:hypothetical protein
LRVGGIGREEDAAIRNREDGMTGDRQRVDDFLHEQEGFLVGHLRDESKHARVEGFPGPKRFGSD